VTFPIVKLGSIKNNIINLTLHKQNMDISEADHFLASGEQIYPEHVKRSNKAIFLP
jgi:hypothetical protein